MDPRSVSKDLVAGSVGGAAGILVGQPLDVVKTRMMMQGASSASASSGVGRMLVDIVRKEGPAALMKGAALPVMSQGLFTSLSFAGYNLTLELLRRVEPGAQARAKGQESNLDIFLAGCVGGALSTLATTPGEVVKIVLQMETEQVQSGGVRRVLKQRWQQMGIRGLYTGWGATALRDTPATGVYFLGYYGGKRALGSVLAPEGQPLTEERRVIVELLAGGGAGVLSWASIIPVDVVKTRIQNGFQGGSLECARAILREEGPKGLFRGAAPCLLRAFPVNACTFFVYEETIRAMDRVERGGLGKLVPEVRRPAPPQLPRTEHGLLLAMSPAEPR
jgi:solute carrier family 25 carnitine/acylcarnitine transporter 20/29